MAQPEDDPQPPLASRPPAEPRGDAETGSAEAQGATQDVAPGWQETLGLDNTLGAHEASQVPGAHVFGPGELVGGRYRIVRFVARGGMGEVYEAEDAELRGRVALKTIRPEVASSHQALERFKREIQLARQVTHPNVCRIFDIGYHRGPGGEADVSFLSMEFLPGETLDKRVRREGRLSPAQALPLVRQMASALAAAHAMGIVHRDFKSGNVALVPASREGEGARAVVTDFGLARGGGSQDSPVATATGHVVGTPAYMAPEQVEGKPVSAAADIYALGVVIYEMVTGKWPFEGDSSLSVAVKRLMEPPAPPRVHVPDLDPLWERTILRCLERQPEDRFARVEDVVEALGGASAGVPRRTRRRRLAWGAGALAVGLLAFGGYRVAVRLSQGTAATAVKARRSVAVLGFKNLTARPEAAWMSAALSEMLTSELAAGGKLRAIPGENVARMQMEMKVTDTDSLAADTLARIRDRLGTDLVVRGSFLAPGKESGGQLRLDIRVQDAADGEIVASVAETGVESEILDLVSRTGAKLRSTLGVEELSPAEAGGARALLPSSPQAARLYAEGLARLRVFDALGARDLLQTAAEADPGYPLVHSALSAAWAALGYEEKAREEAKQALDLSAKLSREDRLSVEGRYRESTKEWDKAASVYRTLVSLFPDSLDYGLRLAGALTRAGEGKQALHVLDSLRALPAPARDDPRVDLAQARAAESLTDLKGQQAMAARAAAKASQQKAWLLVADAKNLEGSALLELGDAPRAKAAFEEAKRLYEAAGHLEGEATTLGMLGKMWVKQGDLNTARMLFETSIEIRKRIGGEEGIAMALHNIAIILYNNGDAVGARKMIEEALKTERAAGHTNHVASELHSLGVLLEDGVDLEGARRNYEEAMRTFRQIGDLKRTAAALIGTANVMLLQGDLDGARKTHEEALAIARQTGDKGQAAEVLFHLGKCLLLAGDLPAARRSHEEALTIRSQIGERASAAESRLSLLELDIEEGHTADAIAPARASAREFADLDVPDEQARAEAILARALLAEAQPAEARAAIETAHSLLQGTSRRDLRLETEILAASLQAAGGDGAGAASALDGVLAEARKSGLGVVQLEARLAMGGVDLARGRAQQGRERLRALEADARAKGFGLIARKAADALR